MENNKYSNLNREQLYEIVYAKVEDAMEALFEDIHKITKVDAGDIDPGQFVQLEELIKQLTDLRLQLTELATEKVWRNMLQDNPAKKE